MYQNFSVRKCFVLAFVLLQFAPANAQSQPALPFVDSLKALIPLSTGTNKYDLTFKVAYELFDVNNQEAVLYAKQAYGLSLELGDSLQITKSGRLLGQLLRRVDRLDEAIIQFGSVLSIAERNQFIDEEKRILNALAVLYIYKAMYDRALEYNFKSLEVREREGDKKEISIALGNIGLVYYKIGDFEQALEFYNRALEAKEQSTDKQAMDELLINMALCYIHLSFVEKIVVI